MSHPARTQEAVINVLHATIGEPMTQYLLAAHHLDSDIHDLLSGDVTLREFGNALHETLQVAANMLPQEMPPNSTKGFILQNPRELQALVDAASSRIAGKEPSPLQR